MNECRNCASQKLLDMGANGVIASFFLKRVFGLELGMAPSRRPIKRFLRHLGLVRGNFERVFRPAVLIDVQFCLDCTFIQTRVPFREDAISKLYVDYRSNSYNDERIRFEPEYARIAADVGASQREIQVRQDGLREFLREHLDLDREYSLLDFGGADGRFLPDLRGNKFVYEISDVAPIPGVTVIRDPKDLARYSYVQIAHVLEHVPGPLELAQKASSYLEDNGYMYIELPQDISDQTIGDIARTGGEGLSIPIHEHINFYTLKSAVKLSEAVGLRVINAHSKDEDLGWTKTRIIRVLAQKSI